MTKRNEMNANAKSAVEESVKGSDEGRLTFPEVVMKLIGAGVERYEADLCRSGKTFYMPDGSFHFVASRALDQEPAAVFSEAGIDKALRAVQSKTIDYRAFCEAIAEAGCVSYLVSIVGRRAIYFGRTGELFVEPFPKAK